MLNRELFAKNMLALSVVYDKDLTKPLQDIYYAVLENMQDEDFKQAIRGLLSERIYPTFPKPAEILERSAVVSIETKEINPLEAEAEKLIELVKGMNESVYQTHIKTGIAFDTLLANVKFPSVDEDTIVILDYVKPYYSHKQLILRVNHYQTTKDALRAFKDAIKNKENNKNALELKKR